MLKVILHRAAIVFAFVAALFFLREPLFAAPAAQTALPDFTLNAQTTITVTVAITDGQVIVVPVELSFVAENANGETNVFLITDVEQQAGIFIGVSPNNALIATIEQPGVAPAASSQTAQGNVTGTHVANQNSRQRAGPGTNFEIVGRVPQGEAVVVVGQNEDGTWLQLDNGNWVAAFLLDPVPSNNDEDGETNESNENGANDGGNNEQSENEQSDEEGEQEQEASVPASPELIAYLEEIDQISTLAAAAAGQLDGLLNDPQPLSSVWRNEIAAQLSALSSALDQYLDLSPVDGYQDLHNQVTNVALTCEQSVDFLAAEMQDPGSINPAIAAQSVERCADQIAVLIQAVESL